MQLYQNLDPYIAWHDDVSLLIFCRDINKDNLIFYCIEHGSLNILKKMKELNYISEYITIGHFDSLKYDRCLFRKALLNGHLHIAQWIYDIERIDIFNYMAENKAYIIRKYNPNVMEWVRKTFDFATKEL